MSLDTIVRELDQALRVCTATLPTPTRTNPAGDGADSFDLQQSQRDESIALMRVNHAGEVAAQALYRGQAIGARNTETREFLNSAAQEELDHLNWCDERLRQLGSAPSGLTPLWYMGALGIGCAVGLLGDRLSLGFVEETERQVGEHLEKHQKRLPDADLASQRVVQQMREDEARHGDEASHQGAEELPTWSKGVMRMTAKVMTTLAARI